jgi:hypothetical protein
MMDGGQAMYDHADSCEQDGVEITRCTGEES